jgi:hypothetical protein
MKGNGYSVIGGNQMNFGVAASPGLTDGLSTVFFAILLHRDGFLRLCRPLKNICLNPDQLFLLQFRKRPVDYTIFCPPADAITDGVPIPVFSG